MSRHDSTKGSPWDDLDRFIAEHESSEEPSLDQLRARCNKAEKEVEVLKERLAKFIEAIKEERALQEASYKELEEEKDQTEQRCNQLEAKLLKLIEVVRADRSRRLTASDLPSPTSTNSLNNEALIEAQQGIEQAKKEAQEHKQAAAVAQERIKLLEANLRKLADALRAEREQTEKLQANQPQFEKLQQQLKEAQTKETQLKEDMNKLKEQLSAVSGGSEAVQKVFIRFLSVSFPLADPWAASDQAPLSFCESNLNSLSLSRSIAVISFSFKAKQVIQQLQTQYQEAQNKSNDLEAKLVNLINVIKQERARYARDLEDSKTSNEELKRSVAIFEKKLQQLAEAQQQRPLASPASSSSPEDKEKIQQLEAQLRTADEKLSKMEAEKTQHQRETEQKLEVYRDKLKELVSKSEAKNAASSAAPTVELERKLFEATQRATEAENKAQSLELALKNLQEEVKAQKHKKMEEDENASLAAFAASASAAPPPPTPDFGPPPPPPSSAPPPPSLPSSSPSKLPTGGSSGNRGDLLKQIQQGKKLRKAATSPRPVPPINIAPAAKKGPGGDGPGLDFGNLAGMASQLAKERRARITAQQNKQGFRRSVRLDVLLDQHDSDRS
ncbi:hypothetical protein QOT17_011210 [Balamuthia mandrillaris]